MGQSSLEIYRPKEQPKILEELSQFYLSDLNDNVSCFRAIYQASPDKFCRKDSVGESPSHTLKRAIIFTNKWYSTALNVGEPVSNSILAKKTPEELIEIFEKQAKNIYSKSQNDPAFFERLVPDPLFHQLNLPEELDMKITGFGFFLQADGQLAQNTGELLKHIDALRAKGVTVKRPEKLSWGPEGKKPIIENESEISEQTKSLLKEPLPVTKKQLRDQIPLLDQRVPGFYIEGYDELPKMPNKFLEIVAYSTRGVALDNHFSYEHLANFTRWRETVKEIDKPIGIGSTPADDLRHEVLNLFKRISVISKDKTRIPPEKDLISLDTERLLNLYLKGTYILIERFADPTTASKTYDWWGPKTGSQLLLSAYRHFMQHGGTLNAHYQAREGYIY